MKIPNQGRHFKNDKIMLLVFLDRQEIVSKGPFKRGIK